MVPLPAAFADCREDSEHSLSKEKQAEGIAQHDFGLFRANAGS
jgi:hypothetical protein